MEQYDKGKLQSVVYIILFVIAGMLIGCSNNTTAPVAGNFSLSIKKDVPSPAAVDQDTLTLETVKILLKNVELFLDSDEEGEEHERSEEVEVGPFVVNLNLSGTLNPITLTNIPEGTYKGVKFEIHRLGREEAAIDSEFIDSTCGEKGYSIIVSGTYLGNPFVFKSGKSFNQRVYFPGPVTITSGGFINVTLTVDPYSWFEKDGNFIDPNNPENYWLINHLIKESFRSFKDDDRDGDPDH